MEAADRQYFDSYSGFGIHRDMLADKVWLKVLISKFFVSGLESNGM